MPRPRIEGMDERIISSFLERKIFPSQREVISAALRALVREQKMKEAAAREGKQTFSDGTYLAQLNINAREEHATAVGHTGRSSTARQKRVESDRT